MKSQSFFFHFLIRPFAAAAIFCSNSPAFTLETDQYLSWDQQLSDSSQLLNKYLEDLLQKALKVYQEKYPNYNSENPTTSRVKEVFGSKLNLFKKNECYQIAEEFIGFQGKPLDYIDHIEYWTSQNSEIQKIPNSSISDKEAFKLWLYRNSAVRGKLFARTLNVNGIYFGLDKLSHFLSIGWEYYEIYSMQIQKKKSELDAIIEATKHGIMQEKTYYGLLMSGVFSFADLEANYQGLLFYKDLCEGPDPILQKTENGWIKSRPLDLRNYVNPDWDESYNPSYYRPRFFQKKVLPNLLPYCSLRNNEIVKQRFDYYLSFPERSANMTYLRDLVQKKALGDPQTQNLEKICRPGDSENPISDQPE